MISDGPNSDVSLKFRHSFLKNAQLGRTDANQLLAVAMKEKGITLTFNDQLNVLQSAATFAQQIGREIINNEMLSTEFKAIGQSYFASFYPLTPLHSIKLMLEAELTKAFIENRLEDAELILHFGSRFMSQKLVVHAQNKIKSERIRLEFEADFPSDKSYRPSVSTAPTNPVESATSNNDLHNVNSNRRISPC